MSLAEPLGKCGKLPNPLQTLDVGFDTRPLALRHFPRVRAVSDPLWDGRVKLMHDAVPLCPVESSVFLGLRARS